MWSFEGYKKLLTPLQGFNGCVAINPGALPRARLFGPFRAVLAVMPIILGVAPA
jgi:hypothetical protein